MSIFFVYDVPQVAKQEYEGPSRIQVPEMGNVFTKDKK